MRRPPKVNEIRKEQEEVEVSKLDRTAVLNKELGAHYRLVSRNSLSHRLAKAKGYVVVERREGGEEMPLMDDAPADGTIGTRDLVLMKKSQADFEKIQAKKVTDNDRLIRHNKERYIEEALREGRMTEAQAKVALGEKEYERR